MAFGQTIALPTLGCGKEATLFSRDFIWSFPFAAVLCLLTPSSEAYPVGNLPTAPQSQQLESSAGQGIEKPTKKKEEKPPIEKAPQQEPPPQSVLTPEQRLSYVIGVEDELQISVWREPELSTVVVVRPDGMITLPLINDVKAVGLKTDELQNLLVEKLKNFVNEPQVTVIARAIHSRKVYLVGQVGHQGTYPLNGDMTALELLAAAGGIGTFAKADSIYILREQNGKKIRVPFHYKKAVAGKSENVLLQPGDVVVVP
jgi:polysaccharide biosynthesis/export protein